MAVRQSVLGNPRKGLKQKEVIVAVLGRGNIGGSVVTQRRTSEGETREMSDAASPVGT